MVRSVRYRFAKVRVFDPSGHLARCKVDSPPNGLIHMGVSARLAK